MPDYIPKSSLDKQQKQEPVKERKKLEPVVQTAAKPKKKSTWDKIKEEMFVEDGQSIGDYLLFDVFIPAFKDTIKSLATNAVDMVLYGGSGKGPNRNLPANRVSFRNYFDYNSNVYNSNVQRSPRSNTTYTYSEVVYDSKGDALSVLQSMEDIISQYPAVTVADYLELSNCPAAFIDNDYGWVSLNNVSVGRTRNGKYFLDLPKPLPKDLWL